MKIGVVGMGGVGGYFGGRIACANQDTHFLVRPQTYEAVCQGGLIVKSPEGDFSLDKVNVYNNASEIGVCDLIIFAVKSYQLGEAIPSARSLVGDGTAILPLMNGVEPVEFLASAYGDSLVLGGLCKILSEKTAPGVISHSGYKPSISLGPRSLPQKATAKRICYELARIDGMEVVLSTDILSDMWTKFIFVTAMATVGSAACCPIGASRDFPGTRSLIEECISEAKTVADSIGINLPNTLTADTLYLIDSLPTNAVASMQRDILEGRQSELEYLTGSIVRLAEKCRLTVPATNVLYRLLAFMEAQNLQSKNTSH